MDIEEFIEEAREYAESNYDPHPLDLEQMEEYIVRRYEDDSPVWEDFECVEDFVETFLHCPEKLEEHEEDNEEDY